MTLARNDPTMKPASAAVRDQFLAAANKRPGATFPDRAVFDGQTVYVRAETKDEAAADTAPATKAAKK